MMLIRSTTLKLSSFVWVFVMFLSGFEFGNSYRILAILPHVGRSHFEVFKLYLEELAVRGHDLVVVSNFPRQIQMKNYTDISLKGSIPVGDIEIISLPHISKETQFESARQLSLLGDQACEIILALPQVKELLNFKNKFDLLISEVFNTDCFLGFANKLKIPVVSWSTTNFLPWIPMRIGNVDNPAYIPITLSNFGSRMNFFERLLNSVCYVVHYVRYYDLFEKNSYEIAKKYFGQTLPTISQLTKNTSVLFVNTHFSLTSGRPQVPGVIEVAGVHIKKKSTLPQELEDYLSGAEHGVIYFSMGSMIRAETLPPEKRDAFLQAFSELPQRVLWKWEGDNLPGQPKNVKTMKWIPQFDVLNHPNIKVFLAHGGLLGTIEAVHVGVPMVGIPMYGDQGTNIRMIEAAGMGVRLNYADITKETVLKALKTVLDNQSYAESAKRTSRAFRDRPMSPMDTAIYWTEYVIRHRGAPHMRTAGADLPLYQYLLLDVIAVLLLAVLTVTYAIYLILKKLLSLICGKNISSDSNKKRQ